MALETLNKDSNVVVYNSDVELADKGVRQNHQGVTAADLNGFVSVDAAAPDSAIGLKGDFSFNDADNKIYVCVSSFGSIYPGRVIPAISAPTGATAGAYTGIVPTGGSGTGLVVTIVMADATTITSITSTTAGSGYKNTDVLTIPAQVVGSSSTTFTASPNIAAIAAEYKSVTLT
jgi:hypothetical protein